MTVDALLTKWLGKKGAGERAEYQHFLTELAQALSVPTPGDDGHDVDDYRFEAPVRSQAAFGTKGTHRIDLYKRDHFILEAKQSQGRPGEALPDEAPEPPPETLYDLFGAPISERMAAMTRCWRGPGRGSPISNIRAARRGPRPISSSAIRPLLAARTSEAD